MNEEKLIVTNDQRVAYGLISKGNGEVILSKEKHMTLSVGGGQAGQGYPAVLVYESHGQDARYKPLGEVCETLSAKYGLGGGNVPIVVKYEEDLHR